MSELSRGERLQIIMKPEEINLIDDWRFANHMPSRAAAVRELIKRGLGAEGFETADYGMKSSDLVCSKANKRAKSPASLLPFL